MRRRLALAAPAVALVVVLAATPPAHAKPAHAAPKITVLEHHGRWESGYGSTFYNVVGRLRNDTGHALRWVKLRVDVLNSKGKVVATSDTYNEDAEALAVPELDPKQLLASGKIHPIPPDAEQRFRTSFLKEETPPFQDYRVRVLEAPPAK